MYRGSYRQRHADLWPTNYKLGMWVWLLHRVTGVIIALYGIAHLLVISSSLLNSDGDLFEDIMKVFENRVLLGFELALIAVILFHTFNGLRVILFDLGIGIRAQKLLFWGLMAVAVILFVFAADALLPYIRGEARL
ncbi:MAG: succinate dehydrogenase, cytochrome b556 subunit [Dehalococcoidia bacterium]